MHQLFLSTLSYIVLILECVNSVLKIRIVIIINLAALFTEIPIFLHLYLLNALRSPRPRISKNERSEKLSNFPPLPIPIVYGRSSHRSGPSRFAAPLPVRGTSTLLASYELGSGFPKIEGRIREGGAKSLRDEHTKSSAIEEVGRGPTS